MTQFVDECRREWKRLRVPDGAANEMATDLAADLRDAERDGTSPEELLGDAAFDPRAFAASWARERGLVAPPRRDAARRRIAGVIAGILVVGAGIVLVVAMRDGSSGAARPSTASAPTATVVAANDVTVPNLVGLARSEAVVSAAAAGLRVAIRYRVQQGPSTLDVAAQSPAAGVAVKRGTTVLIVVRR